MSKIRSGYAFNAVIEGQIFHHNYLGNERSLQYKMTNVDISSTTSFIDDRMFSYRLHGKTDDFDNGRSNHFNRVELESLNPLKRKKKEITDFIGFQKGFVITSREGVTNISPRSIFLRDGRIYTNTRTQGDEEYMSVLTWKVLKNVKEIFTNEEFDKIYRFLMEQEHVLSGV